MVKRTARNSAIGAIRRFRDAAITNDEFVEEYPGATGDPTIAAIADALWHSYDDLNEHRLTGRYALSPEGMGYYNRCILLLATDLDYRPTPGPVRRLVASLIGEELKPGTRSDSPVWPFQSWEAYEAAVESFSAASAAERGAEVEYAWARAEVEAHRASK